MSRFGLTAPECGSVGFPGVRSSDGKGKICCMAECGQCGGEGCSTFAASKGLGADECCTKEIRDNNKLCSEEGMAPCVIEASEFLPNVDAADAALGAWLACCLFVFSAAGSKRRWWLCASLRTVHAGYIYVNQSQGRLFLYAPLPLSTWNLS